MEACDTIDVFASCDISTTTGACVTVLGVVVAVVGGIEAEMRRLAACRLAACWVRYERRKHPALATAQAHAARTTTAETPHRIHKPYAVWHGHELASRTTPKLKRMIVATNEHQAFFICWSRSWKQRGPQQQLGWQYRQQPATHPAQLAELDARKSATNPGITEK